ncbi:MAG: hypothetical protein K6347_07810 [Campylobacterales bacterium]
MLPKYEQKLREIRNDISTMAEFVLESFKNSYDGVRGHDLTMIDNAKKGQLGNLGYLANSIDNNIIVTFALYTPEAGELRELIALLKATNEMVRMGDAARNYATGMHQILSSNVNITPFQPFILELHSIALRSIELLIKGLADFNHEIYRAILVEEDKSDEILAILNKEIIATVCEDKSLVELYIKILNTVKRLERATDRVASIAKLILYAKEGGRLEFN